jgi:hypothetical protein
MIRLVSARGACLVAIGIAMLLVLPLSGEEGLGGRSRLAGTTYYVSSAGDDDGTGMSPDEAWQTIAKVSSMSFLPGDAIRFRAGDEWYESLVISSSGTAEEPILFGAYGSGPRPRILGSIRLTSWSHAGGSIWVSVDETTDPSRGAPHDGSSSGSGGYPGGAWFVSHDGSITWGHQERYIDFAGDLGDLTQEHDWGWYDGHIYLFSTEDPTTAYDSVQVSQRQYAIGMPDNDPQEHIVIDGLELMFTQSKGFFGGYPAAEAHDLTIRDCHVGYIGIKGAASAYGLAVWHSDLLIQDNEIHDCGRRSVSYNVYATRNVLFENVIIEGNHFHHGYHTTGIDIYSAGSDQMDSFIIRNNLFEGDPAEDLGAVEGFSSNHIWTQANQAGRLSGFEITNNVFTYCHGKGLTVNQMTGVLVAFNTFYGVNPTLANYQAQLYFSNSVSNAVVRNNLFVNDVDPSFNPYFFCVKADSDNMAGIDMDRNLYFTTHADAAMVDIVGITGVYTMDEWDTYRAETGWDAASPMPQPPGLVDGPGGDLHPSAGSPAVGAGIALPGLTTDFDGNLRSDPPCLGAFEQSGPALLFADDFESGDESAWSTAVP